MRFLFSLDFETLYGTWDMNTEEYIKSNILNAYEALDKIIDLHEEAKIKLNVAIVGLLLPNDKEEDLDEILYRNREQKMEVLKAYMAKPEYSSLLKCPENLLNKLKNSDYVELISHTVCHNYFDKLNDEDLQQEYKINEGLVEAGVLKKGIIFPKNIVSAKKLFELDLYKDFTVRVNYQNKIYNPKEYNLFIRIIRFIDTFLPLNEMFGLKTVKDQPNTNIKFTYGSVFFRPEFSRNFLSKLHRLRVRFAIKHCQRKNLDFHLWSHPHNFGKNVDISIANYRKVLKLINNKHKSIFFSEV